MKSPIFLSKTIGWSGCAPTRRTARANFAPTLMIGADGRHAVTHARAGLEIREFGVPIDVLWMRISKRAGDPEQSLGFFRHGKFLVLLDRGDYFQVGFVIPKGGFDEIRRRGLPELHRDIVELVLLQDRITELDDWSKIKLLSVQINRLRRSAGRPALHRR